MTICNGLKRTVSANDGLGLLQMVLDPDTKRCASEDAGLQGGDCKIPRRLERGTKHPL